MDARPDYPVLSYTVLLKDAGRALLVALVVAISTNIGLAEDLG